jgi:RNAse (barnase) inhibitor barstar
VNNGVLFDVSDLRQLSDALDDGVGETTSVPLEVTIVHLADANGTLCEERIFLVSVLEEVEMIVEGGRVEVVLQHDDVRVVEDLVGVLSLEGMEGGEGEGGPLRRNIMGGR